MTTSRLVALSMWKREAEGGLKGGWEMARPSRIPMSIKHGSPLTEMGKSSHTIGYIT